MNALSYKKSVMKNDAVASTNTRDRREVIQKREKLPISNRYPIGRASMSLLVQVADRKVNAFVIFRLKWTCVSRITIQIFGPNVEGNTGQPN